MKVTYISAPRDFDVSPNDWQRDHIRNHTMQVIEGEPITRRTGILDKRGNPIIAIIETGPIGFGK